MSISKIEKLYEEKKHERVVNEYLETASSSSDEHLLRLFLRSANIIGKRVFDFVQESLMGEETDYLFNKFLYGEAPLREDAVRLLRKILLEDRKDMLEDFVITCMDKTNLQPIFEELNEFLINNKNKDIVTDYLKMTDDKGEDLCFLLIKSFILKKDPAHLFEERDKDGIMISSFEHFLKGKELTLELFEKYASGAKFKENMFVLFENELYRIEKFDKESQLFTLKDRFAGKRQVKYSIIAEKTSPIEKDDFRVYKYFKPEEAKEIPPCQLVVMILKYKNSALDKSQLKDELVYIFGKDASSYLTKNKKILEQCADLEIIYEKPERFVLAINGNLVSNKVKKMKTIDQIRDYMMTAMKNREIGEDDREIILKHIETIKDERKNEVLHLVTGDEEYAKQASDDDLENAVYMKFIFDALKSRMITAEAVEKDIERTEKLDPQHIEKLYECISKSNKIRLLESVHKGFRLSKNMTLVEWYLTYHLEETLFEMNEEYLVLRTIMISNDIHAMRKTDEFLNFMRRYFFDPKKKKFLDVIKKTNDETGKRIFDEFMKILYLNDYQKDEIRKQVYSIRPEYRDYKASEFLLSTHGSIKRKQEEFAEITEKVLPKLSKTIQEAAALGDLSENSEYKFSREQYRLFSLRAEELKNQLSKMEPIDISTVSGEKVEPGTIVTLLNKIEGETKTYTILGVFDVDVDRNIISYLSPLVKKLSGMKKNEETNEFKILDIKKCKEE
ncbi:MAG: GreA/GreB family elongation factor [bacterium]